MGGAAPPTGSTVSEEFDGTNWTEGNDLNAARLQGSGFGIQTAAGYAGGYGPGSGANALTEIYNGTSWTEVGDLGTARYNLTREGAGTTTAALVAGGDGSKANTEEFTGEHAAAATVTSS